MVHAALRHLVLAAFLADGLRAPALRFLAVLLAWRERALWLAAERGSRFRALAVARERVEDGLRFERDATTSCCAFFRVRAELLVGSFTPERRALERPMAIACLVDAAPCFPSRI